MDPPQISPQVSPQRVSPRLSPPSAFIEDALNVMLYEISMRMDETTLGRMNGTAVGPLLQKTKKDQLWWHGRTEYLVGREIPYDRTFEWQLIHNSLALHGVEFNEHQDYAAVGLVRVLVLLNAPLGTSSYTDSGTSFEQEAGNVAALAGVADFSALLSDKRFARELRISYCLQRAIARGNFEVVEFLDKEGVLDEDVLPNSLLEAIQAQEIRTVAYILEKGSPGPDDRWKEVIKINRFDMFQLFQKYGSISYEDAQQCLKIAINRGLTVFVLPLLVALENQPSWTALASAVEIGRTEIVTILLQNVDNFDQETVLNSLELAKRRNDEVAVRHLRAYLARLIEDEVEDWAGHRKSRPL